MKKKNKVGKNIETLDFTPEKLELPPEEPELPKPVLKNLPSPMSEDLGREDLNLLAKKINEIIKYLI